jgi:hypothetical protein
VQKVLASISEIDLRLQAIRLEIDAYLSISLLEDRTVFGDIPSSIYSWSVSHILIHEFFYLDCLGSTGSKEEIVDLRFSEQLLRMVFSTFYGQEKT